MPMLGTDPEIFAFRDSECVPAYYLIGDNDVELPFGILQPDGAALEFTVEPSDDVDVLVSRTFENLNAVREIVNGVELLPLSSAEIPQRYIDALTPDYGPRVSLQMFGCAPDVCAYDEIYQRPDPADTAYRSTGGHVHIQVGAEVCIDFDAVRYLTLALDMTLGVMSVALMNQFSNRSAEVRRRSLYGRAGAIRVNVEKGIVEYRVLPSWMLLASEEVSRIVFDTAHQIGGWFERKYSQGIIEAITGGYQGSQTVSHCINQALVDQARHYARAAYRRFRNAEIISIDLETAANRSIIR